MEHINISETGRETLVDEYGAVWSVDYKLGNRAALSLYEGGIYYGAVADLEPFSITPVLSGEVFQHNYEGFVSCADDYPASYYLFNRHRGWREMKG